MKPLITTLIPTYRRPQLLARAIESALAQTETRLQICVFDNASGDDTAAVVSRISARDSRVRYFCHNNNIGAIENYAYAINSVETPYFSLFADDDLLLPDFYANALQMLEKHRESAFCGGLTQIQRGEESLGTSPKQMPSGLLASPDAFRALAKYHITWTSILFRHELTRQVGPLDPNSGLFAEQDYELRIARKFPVYFLAQPMAIWFVHPDYAHVTNHLKNWQAALHIGINHMTSKEATPAMRRQFWSWFDANWGKWTRRLLSANDAPTSTYHGLLRELSEKLEEHQAAPSFKFRWSLRRSALPLLPPMRQIKAAVKKLRVLDPFYHIKEARRRRKRAKEQGESQSTQD